MGATQDTSGFAKRPADEVSPNSELEPSRELCPVRYVHVFVRRHVQQPVLSSLHSVCDQEA
jgi:hypothetical protein